ncbi:hypothetical protein [Embleya sp. NPDC001921]
MVDQHRVGYEVIIADTEIWLTQRGYTLFGLAYPSWGVDTFEIRPIGGGEPITMHIGDTLIWDGTDITVAQP